MYLPPSEPACTWEAGTQEVVQRQDIRRTESEPTSKELLPCSINTTNYIQSQAPGGGGRGSSQKQPERPPHQLQHFAKDKIKSLRDLSKVTPIRGRHQTWVTNFSSALLLVHRGERGSLCVCLQRRRVSGVDKAKVSKAAHNGSCLTINSQVSKQKGFPLRTESTLHSSSHWGRARHPCWHSDRCSQTCVPPTPGNGNEPRFLPPKS